MNYYWFHVYSRFSDGYIHKFNSIIQATCKQEAEKKAKEPGPYGEKVLAVVFKTKAEEHDSRAFKIGDLAIIPGELKKLGLDGIAYEAPLVPVEEEIVEIEEDRKFKVTKCKYCNESIPKNGAAQFSHIKKHVRQLAKMGVISEKQANIKSIKVSAKLSAILRKYIS